MSSPSEEEPPPISQTPEQAAMAKAELAALEEDSAQLMVGLLAVFAAYAAYRTARGKIVGPPAVWKKVLRLDALIGQAMLDVAFRALARQRRRDPKHGKKLFPYTDTAARVSVDSQMRELVTALQYYQRHDAHPIEKPKPDKIQLETPKPKPGPKPKDHEVELPSAANPPEALAENIAVIGRNTAQIEAEIELAREEAEGSTWKTWHSVADSHVRPSHQYLGSAKYEEHSVPITEPFTTIYGDKMNFPGDPTLGAPLNELINCRCFMTFDKKKKLDPDEPMYLPAYWIKQPKGVQHNEAERRAAEEAAREKLLAEKEIIYTQKFGPKPVKAAVEPITAARSYQEWMHPRGMNGKWIDKGAQVNIFGADGKERRATITGLTPEGPTVRYKDNGETGSVALNEVKDRVVEAPKPAAMLSNRQLVDTTRETFGADSPEAKAATRRFGGEGATEQTQEIPDNQPLPPEAQETIDNLKIESIPSDFKLVLDGDTGLVYGRDRNNQMWEITPEGKYKTSLNGRQYNEAALTDVTARWKPPGERAEPSAPSAPDLDLLSRVMRGESVVTPPRAPQRPDTSQSPEAEKALRMHAQYGANSPEYKAAMRDYRAAERGIQFTDAMNMTDAQRLENVGHMYGTSSERYAKAKARYEAAAKNERVGREWVAPAQPDVALLSQIMNGEVSPHIVGPPRQNTIVPNGTPTTENSLRTIERMPEIEPEERIVVDPSTDTVFVQEEQGTLFEVAPDGTISMEAVDPPDGIQHPPDTSPTTEQDRETDAEEAVQESRSYRQQITDSNRADRLARRIERKEGRRERRQARIDAAERIDWKALSEILFQITKDIGKIVLQSSGELVVTNHIGGEPEFSVLVARFNPNQLRGKDGKWIEMGGWIDIDAPSVGWPGGEKGKRRAKVDGISENGVDVTFADNKQRDRISTADVGSRVAQAKDSVARLDAPSAGEGKTLTSDQAAAYWEKRYGPGSLPATGADILKPSAAQKKAAVKAKKQSAAVVLAGMADVSTEDMAKLDEILAKEDRRDSYASIKEFGGYIRLNPQSGHIEEWYEGESPGKGVPADSPKGEAMFRQSFTTGFISAWAKTSGKGVTAEALQMSAAKTFDIQNPAKSPFSNISKRTYEENAHVFDAFHQAQYAATQKKLKADGFSHFVVRRGMILPIGTETGAVGDKVTSNLRAASSVSVHGEVADRFADSIVSSVPGVGVVLEHTIPIESVIGMPGTGVGCLEEGELVIMGGDWPGTIVGVY